MRRTLAILAALVASIAIAAPVGAITNGAPDAGEHPYVGELLFYVPDVPSSRFSDPGGWFTCSGTLLSPTVLVTAGHCTFGVGLNSASTTHDGADTDAAHGGVGGNDVWVSFAAAPNFDILPPSSTFATQAARYAGWTDRSERQQRVAPRRRDAASAVRRPCLLRPRRGRRAPVHARSTLPKYGAIPPLNWLNRYGSQPRNTQRFETRRLRPRARPGQEGVRRRHAAAVTPEARQPARATRRTPTS